MIGNGSDEWSLFAKDPGAERAWLVELQAFPLTPTTGNSGALGEPSFGEFALGELGSDIQAISLTTLRFSSHGMTTGPSETPASTYYPARVEAVRLDARVTSPLISGAATVFAEIDLINTDGSLDGLLEAYAVDGRTCNILLGDPSWPRTAGALPYFFTLFEGVVIRAEVQYQRVRLTLDSMLRLLEVPIQPNLYSGADANGTLVGLPKPLVFGRVRNIPPLLVDPVSLVYQVHDGAVADVTAVYDRGVPLTKVTTSPGLGEYLVNTANGTFQLGGAPDGQVTADVTGVMGLSSLWWSVLRAIVTHTTLSVTVDNGDLVSLMVALPGDGGAWVGPEPVMARDLVSEVAAGTGAFVWTDFGANLRINHLYLSPAAGVITLDETDVIDVERVPLDPSLDPGTFQFAVGYDRNYTVQTDLADAVESSRLGDVALPEKTFTFDDPSIRSRHLLAKSQGISSAFLTQDAARNLASAMMAIWGKPRARLRLRTGLVGLLLQLGDELTLNLTRFNAAGGIKARVVRSSFDSSADGTVDLEVAVSDPNFYVYEDIVLGTL